MHRIPGGEGIAAREEAHRDRVTALAYSPDGRLLASGSVDRSVRLWTHDGETLHEVISPMIAGGPIRDLVFSPDGHLLAVAVEGECAIRVSHLDRLRQHLKSVGLDW